MSNDLINVINNIIKQNQSIITTSEPNIGNPDEIIIKCFNEEQRSKTSYQPLLILGLILFLIVQLLYTNHLYDEAIMKLLSINDIGIELAPNYFELYNNILNQLNVYTVAVLGEFISVFYFIVRWGFDSTLSDLFSNLFFKKSKEKSKNRKREKS